MKGDTKVIDYLNKALAIGRSPSYGARNQSRRCSMRPSSSNRIIFLDGFPNMQTLESLDIGKNVKEVLERDLKAEMEAHALRRERPLIAT